MKLMSLIVITNLFIFVGCNRGAQKAISHAVSLRVGIANSSSIKRDSTLTYCVNLTDDTLQVSDSKYLANVYPMLSNMEGERVSTLIRIKLNFRLRDSLITLAPRDSIARVQDTLLSEFYAIHPDSTYLIEAAFTGKIYRHGRSLRPLVEQVKTRVE